MGKKICIIGAGPAGIFTALELLDSNNEYDITIFEKGKRIENRECSKSKKDLYNEQETSDIVSGFSGAGAYSDGKLSLSPYVGGLDALIESSRLQKLIDYTFKYYYKKFGADTKTYGIENSEKIRKLKRKAIEANLRLIDYPLKHLGTEGVKQVFSKIQKYLLDSKIKIKFNTKVDEIIVRDREVKSIITNENKEYNCDIIVVAVGRGGADWFSGVTKKLNIKTEVNPVDLGVRIEVKDEIMEDINRILYEGKLIYYTGTYDDKVRTFCQNPSGFVSSEYYDNRLAIVNGHSFKNKKSENTNFALLVSHNFDHPFNQPIEYGKKVAEMGNILAEGKILVQRYGDFIRGRRSTKRRILRGNIKPTLIDAEPGDLGHAIPYRTMLDIKETIEALDKLIPGVASDETLMYGVEVKFYSNKIKVDKNFQTNIKGLFAGGDGAGITRGLMHSSVNGVLIGKAIKNYK